MQQLNSNRESVVGPVGVYLAGSVLTTLLSLLTWPVYTRFMTPSEFGPLAIMISIATLFASIVDIGVQYPIIREARDGKVEPALAIGVVCVSIALGFMVLLFPVILNWYRETLLPRSFRLPPDLVWLVVLGTGLGMFASPAQGYLRAKDRPLQYVALSLFPAIAGITAGLTVLYNTRNGLLAVGAGLFGRGCLQTLLGMRVSLKAAPLNQLRRLTKYSVKRFFAISLPYVPHMFFSQLMWVIPRWSLGIMSTSADVSFYSLASILLRPVNMLFSATNRAWPPEVVKLDSPQSAASLHRQASVLTMVVTAIGSIAITVPEGVYETVLGSGWSGARSYVPYMVIAAISVGLYTFPGAVFLAEDKTGYAPRVSGVAMIITVVGSLILGKLFGGTGIGAALALGGLAYIGMGSYWAHKIGVLEHSFQQTVPNRSILIGLLVLILVALARMVSEGLGVSTGLGAGGGLMLAAVVKWRSRY